MTNIFTIGKETVGFEFEDGMKIVTTCYFSDDDTMYIQTSDFVYYESREPLDEEDLRIAIERISKLEIEDVSQIVFE